jgi:hypothetical protein
LTAAMTGATDRTSFPTSADARPRERFRYTSLVAVAAGACWTIGIVLVSTRADSDPVGAGYDAANRALTPALVLLVALAWLLRSSPPAGSRSGAAAFGIGALLLLAGNVLEFWAVLASDLHTEKTAARMGEQDAFWGSLLGWMVFLLGTLVLVAAAVIMVRAVGGLLGWLQLVLAVVGLSATALWAVSPLLAAAAALALAAWLLVLDWFNGRPGRAAPGTDVRRCGPAPRWQRSAASGHGRPAPGGPCRAAPRGPAPGRGRPRR